MKKMKLPLIKKKLGEYINERPRLSIHLQLDLKNNHFSDEKL